MKISSTILALSTIFIFSACNDNNNDKNATIEETPTPTVTPTPTPTPTPQFNYEVSVTNLSVGQPLSPILVTSKSLYRVGESASVALEYLAEGGNNTMLLDDKSITGTGLILPSKSETLTFKTEMQKISIASMLVNTNDGFVGMNEYNLSTLEKDKSVVLYLNVYDAGTEENDESNSTVPGQKGEGFNTTRESRNSVAYHNGVLTKDDGLPSSGLNELHRFQNPFAVLKIIRK